MNRRTLVRVGVAAGATALAGCIGAGGGPGGQDDGDSTGDGGDGAGGADDGAGGDDDGDDGTGDGRTLGEPTFEVVSAGCGTGRSTVAIDRDEAGGRVLVDGVISAPTACYTAALDEAVYGAPTDSVWVDVVTEERPDAEVCAQCITEIEYRVTLPFAGGLPSRIAVTHDDELVCPPAEESG